MPLLRGLEGWPTDPISGEIIAIVAHSAVTERSNTISTTTHVTFP
jgi:hypothetical protein